MQTKRALRYLAPNLITAVGLCFGLMSLKAAFEGRYIDSAWLIIYAVLTDRLDGFVARLVRGTSELGVQLDSFADFLNFGLVPAILIYLSLGQEPSLPFTDGAGRAVLMLGCAVWIFGATFRLARYNITPENPGPMKIFFGIPTTMAAGLVVAWYLALAKYAEPSGSMGEHLPFGGFKLLGEGFTTPEAVWRYFPATMLVGGVLMASSLRMPKLGLQSSKAFTIFVFTNVFLGYVAGFARFMPEYMIWPPTMWFVTFLIWGQLSREAKTMRPPPIFPDKDPPPGLEPVRPEDDLLPEGETLDADDFPNGSVPRES
jgi:CDP-diacylglycerol--serine O-phosphatidyltransferase